MGTGECEFFSDEIALRQGTVCVEVGIVAQALLVTSSGEAKIGSPWFAERMVTGKNREGGGKGRIERGARRWPPRCWSHFLVALNPRKLAPGVQNHLLILRRSPDWERNDQSH